MLRVHTTGIYGDYRGDETKVVHFDTFSSAGLENENEACKTRETELKLNLRFYSSVRSLPKINSYPILRVSSKKTQTVTSLIKIMEVAGGGGALSREIHSPFALAHSVRVLEIMNKHRKDCLKLCDVVLKIGDEHIPTHRAVLAACSPYFYAMFTSDLVESRQKVVTMKDIDAGIIQQLVEFAYTGKVDVNVENVQSILATASLVQFHEVRDLCCKFLETQLDPSNCLGIRKFTEAHGCTNFLEVVDNFVLENFREVLKSEEYALLPCELLIKVISSDDLNVVAEEEVYEAVMAWVKHDLNNRVKQLPNIIHFVRMPLISKHYLLNIIDVDSLIRSNLTCRDLLDEAKNYHLLPEQRAQLRTDRMKPRKSMMGTLYAIGGKEAGETISNTVECYRFALCTFSIDSCV